MLDKKTILIVEDDEAIRFGTSIRLKANGFAIQLAGNGQEGIDMANRFLPDLIIMDIRMPVLNGLEALQSIKSDMKTMHIPVIIASASPGDKEFAIDTGAVFFLSKPYSNENLLSMIEASLNPMVST